MSKGKAEVLIVDDQLGMLETFKDILTDRSYGVDTAEDGYMAIRKAKEKKFDIIFMDMKMPGINGVQTFREIKKISPDTAVIMMTAYAMEDLIKEAISEGAYAVVYKPFDVDRIIQTIEDVLKNVLVLVVDDTLEDRQTLKDILESKSYKVTTAKDGHEAIEVIKQQKVNIIFVDVKMPGIDGVKTFEEIHKIAPSVPVIMITGYSVDDMVKEAMCKGAYACLFKPIDVEKLLSIMEDVTKKKKK